MTTINGYEITVRALGSDFLVRKEVSAGEIDQYKSRPSFLGMITLACIRAVDASVKEKNSEKAGA